MKNSTALLIILCFLAFKPAQAQIVISKTDSVHRLVDTVLQFAKDRSFYRGQVNWISVTDSVQKKASNATSIKEAIPAIQLLFRLLGDHHGFITYGNTSYGWHHGDAPLDRNLHQGLLKKYREGYHLTPKVIEKKYGYLLLPNNNPTHPGDLEKIGQQIRDSLALFNGHGFKGVIIDLRLNPGGSMWPMIGGLAALFGPGKLGAFAFPEPQPDEAWGIENNKVYDGADTTYSVKSRGKDLSSMKVVVLIGPYTRSSGEALAISFKGRPNTWFIGENSGGYTTANESIQFTNQIGIFIATSVEADRNGRIYPDYIKPDAEIIGGDNFDDLTKDKKIIAALEWLKHQ
ncbi:S41 family peptidase [Mucilaginibacter segetis]|uniref:S41 family peptidase n=1 Tax=Mucilaginibacter segetis TaxID=2793071 RepID=A0A934PS45_9SPHI|nr:S41 family peptidase [Mucilaginibacter segetis]MBK0378462.1 S41 family peptidase [Mucilaginibacter segetis]